MDKIHAFLKKNIGYYGKLSEKSKGMSLPGFGGIPLYYFIRFFILRMVNENLNIRASAIAFNFFLALIPGLIFIFSLIPYFQIEDLHAEILIFMSELLPDSAYETIRETLVDILKTPRGGLLSFGFFLTIFYATNGVFSLMEAFDKDDPRSYFKKRLVALGLTTLEALLLIMCIILLIAGEFGINYFFMQGFSNDYAFYYLFHIFRWVVFFIIIYVSISLLFYYGTHRKKRWRFFMPGSLVGSIIIMLSTYAFGYYVDNFSQYNKFYGSLGTLIMLMILIYINSFVMLIGYEINNIILLARKQRAEKQAEAKSTPVPSKTG